MADQPSPGRTASNSRRQQVLRFLKAHSKRDVAAVAKLCTENIRCHGSGWKIEGRDAYLKVESRIFEQRPDLEIVPEEIIVSDEAVVVRWLDKSTCQVGDKKRPVIKIGCTVYHFEGDAISDIAVYIDGMDVARQLME